MYAGCRLRFGRKLSRHNAISSATRGSWTKIELTVHSRAHQFSRVGNTRCLSLTLKLQNTHLGTKMGQMQKIFFCLPSPTLSAKM
ncbi:hypothetical protein FKM82_012822 [Ascaphus truei]